MASSRTLSAAVTSNVIPERMADRRTFENASESKLDSFVSINPLSRPRATDCFSHHPTLRPRRPLCRGIVFHTPPAASLRRGISVRRSSTVNAATSYAMHRLLNPWLAPSKASMNVSEAVETNRFASLLGRTRASQIYLNSRGVWGLLGGRVGKPHCIVATATRLSLPDAASNDTRVGSAIPVS